VVEASQKGVKYELDYKLIGGAALDVTGDNPLPQATFDAAHKADAILFGSVGGPEWGVTLNRPEEGLNRLRESLDVYGNVRPCVFASQSLLQSSPLKASVAKDINFTIVRELMAGEFFGERLEDDGSGYATDQIHYTREEIQRVARLAAYLALQSDPPQRVTSVDKANVLATSRLWRKTVTELYEKEFPQLELRHQLVDSCALLMAKSPSYLNGIVVTPNLFGDILSDLAGGIQGSLGLLPAAELSGIPGSGKINALYQPCHGSAPDIAGKGIANPVAMILCVAMMLRWSFGFKKEAQAVEDAVRKVLDAKVDGGFDMRTKDLGGSSTTTQIGEQICKVLKDLLV